MCRINIVDREFEKREGKIRKNLGEDSEKGI